MNPQYFGDSTLQCIVERLIELKVVWAVGGLDWTVLVPARPGTRSDAPGREAHFALFDPHHLHHHHPLIFVVTANAATISGDACREALLQIS